MWDKNVITVWGTFGIGKTFTTVEEVYRSFSKEGDIVISNMWLAFPHIRVYTISDLVPILKEIQHYHRENIVPNMAPPSFLLAHDIPFSSAPGRTFTILIDEGIVFAGKRGWEANFADEELRIMIAMPRHFNLRIIYIAQKVNGLDKFIRDMTTEILEITRSFVLWRKVLSYDVDRFFADANGGFNLECPIIEDQTYFDWWRKKKARIEHFGGLYFSEEALGNLAIKHVSHIRSIRSYIQQESELIHWRSLYLKKLGIDLALQGKSLKSAILDTLNRDFSEKIPEDIEELVEEINDQK